MPPPRAGHFLLLSRSRVGWRQTMDRFVHPDVHNGPLSVGCAVRRPFGGEDGHHGGVDPLVAVAERFAEHSLDAEAGLLVGPAGARVEGVDLERDAVQAEVLEAVADDQPGRLGAEAAVAAARADQDAEVAALVAGIPLAEHGLADA